jgi:hypothetical protein
MSMYAIDSIAMIYTLDDDDDDDDDDPKVGNAIPNSVRPT